MILIKNLFGDRSFMIGDEVIIKKNITKKFKTPEDFYQEHKSACKIGDTYTTFVNNGRRGIVIKRTRSGNHLFVKLYDPIVNPRTKELKTVVYVSSDVVRIPRKYDTVLVGAALNNANRIKNSSKMIRAIEYGLEKRNR